MNNINNHQISEQAKNELFAYYIQIPNTGFHPDYVKKRNGLMMAGLSAKEAEKLCRPRSYTDKDTAQMLTNGQEQTEKEVREYERMQRKEAVERIVVQRLRAVGCGPIAKAGSKSPKLQIADIQVC